MFDLSFVFVGLGSIVIAVVLIVISERMRDKKIFNIQ
jgi:hypothetical protein